MGHSKLTAKQESFASDIANKKYKFHWLAYESNYNCSKMSQNAMYVEACLLLQNPKVAQRIKEIEDKIKDKEKITLDEIIVKLSERCSLDVREMFNDDDSMKPIREMTQEQAVFISSFDVQEIWGYEDKKRKQIGVVKKVKMESIQSIMDMLIKVYGGYAKDNEQKSGNLDEIRELVDQMKTEE